MTPEQWQKVKQLVQAALEREAGERAAFLDQACAGDASLRAEIESLLGYQERAEDFIETPAVHAAASSLPDDSDDAMAGRRIGPYKVLHKLGHGGMGAVYLATRADFQYQKRVAIKLIKPGLDSEEILRRFRHERQILASLDHPNIARLYDGGTTEECLPYFVMEYIEGLPIDEYCNRHKLSIIERLKLFRTVCAAVHYAHQNLVVHRDIKPSNILVTAEGVPKLLDFGIAKLLNPELFSQTIDATATAMRLMTPEYGSPEQVRGEPITTATDVYSLGVVLYELLTGRRPYQFKTSLPREIERVICETEPEKPSTAISRQGSEQEQRTTDDGRRTAKKLSRQLKGDLDNIVLMALRKEPQRRYTSGEQFSEDVRRYLGGLPVIARQDTLGYRSVKFVKRHKAGVITATLIVVSLIGGIVAITHQARVAERRFNQVRKLANSLVFDLHDEIQDLSGSTRAREKLVKMALEYLNGLAQEASQDSSLQRELALTYQKVGDVQGNPYVANLGDTAGALESYRKALAIRQVLVAGDRANTQFRRDLAVSYNRVADMLALTGDTVGALEGYRKALAIREALVAGDQTNKQFRRDLAISYERIGDTLMTTGNLAEALDHHRKSLALSQAMADENPRSVEARRGLFISFTKIGDVLALTGDPTAARENYHQAVAVIERLSSENPENALFRRDLSIGYDNIGDMLKQTGDLAAALQSYRTSLAITEALAAKDPTNVQLRRDVAASYDRIGNVLASKDAVAALQSYRKSLAISETLLANNPNDAELRRSVARSHSRIGHVLASTGDAVGALESQRKALMISEALSAEDPTNTWFLRDLAVAYTKLGEAHTVFASKSTAPVNKRTEHWRQARSWHQKSLNLWLDMRNRGILRGSDASVLDEIAREITKCDAALVKLLVSPKSRTRGRRQAVP
jgi:serine/threonine protein kinase/Flp pilus assembly protein TadD